MYKKGELLYYHWKLSEPLFFNAKQPLYQLHHGKNGLHAIR